MKGAPSLARRFPQLSDLARDALSRVRAGRAFRIGEAAVISTKLHVLDPRQPDDVMVVTDRDAGQVFYGHRQAGQILHCDLFHALAQVPPHRVAQALAAADAAFAQETGLPVTGLLDRVDLQTGLGGGRATGQLHFGTRASLRAAHENHVHMAMELPLACAALLWYRVAAAERALADDGVGIRRIENVWRVEAGRVAPDDLSRELSPYAAVTDTLLREPGSASAYTTPASETELLAQAMQLAGDLGSVEAAQHLLQEIGGRLHLPLSQVRLAPLPMPPHIVREQLRKMSDQGLLQQVAGAWALTERGEALRRYLETHAQEVQLALRTAVRRVTGGAAGPWRRGRRIEWLDAERGHASRVEPLGEGQPIRDLAVPETVTAALRRGCLEAAAGPFTLVRGDLRIRRKSRPRPVEVCLLVDASASMAGQRMRAAKDLVRHLLLTSRDRVAVITFQERQASLRVPFTRNYAAVERGLGQIHPAGLTPLAQGLETALAYMTAARVKNPLLMLVTDGIPTVSRGVANPLDDALAMADALRAADLAVACVGLEPNRTYLSELVRRAGGSLYVVNELDQGQLAEIAHRERMKQKG